MITTDFRRVHRIGGFNMYMQKKYVHRLNVRITDDEFNMLSSLSKSRKMNTSQMLRYIITQYLSNEKKGV